MYRNKAIKFDKTTGTKFSVIFPFPFQYTIFQCKHAGTMALTIVSRSSTIKQSLLWAGFARINTFSWRLAEETGSTDKDNVLLKFKIGADLSNPIIAHTAHPSSDWTNN